MPLVNYARVLFDLGKLDQAGDYAERGWLRRKGRR
jgi:hypothetical protein